MKKRIKYTGDKKIFFLILIHFFIFSIQAQEHVRFPGDKEFSVDIIYTYDYYLPSSVIKLNENIRFDLIQKYNFSTGIYTCWKIKDNLLLCSGFLFSRRHFYANVFVDDIMQGVEDIRLNYFDVPLLVNYIFINKKIKFSIISGILGSIKINQTKTKISPDVILCPNLISFTQGIGTSLPVGKKTNLVSSLNYNHFFDISGNTFSKFRGLSFQFGIRRFI